MNRAVLILGLILLVVLASRAKAGTPVFGACRSGGYSSCYNTGDTPRRLALDPEGFKAAKERNKLRRRIQVEKDVWGISYTELCFIRQYGFRPVFD